MQKYSNAIRSKDLIDVASVDMIRNSKLDKEIQKFILDIHINGEKKTYKEKIKYLKDIYENFGVEELLYGYIYYSNYILNVQLSRKDESEDETENISQDGYNIADRTNLIHSIYLSPDEGVIIKL